jgi:hypothetical protein
MEEATIVNIIISSNDTSDIQYDLTLTSDDDGIRLPETEIRKWTEDWNWTEEDFNEDKEISDYNKYKGDNK